MRNKVAEKLIDMEAKLPRFESLTHVTMTEAAAQVRGLIRSAFYLGALSMADQHDVSCAIVEETVKMFPMPVTEAETEREFRRKQ